MILRALYDYYQTLSADPDSGISKPGYSKEKVSFVISLSKKGDLRNLIEIREGNKPVLMDVPLHAKRTSGVLPHFLCDNSKYLLGFEKENFKQCVELHKAILKDVDDESAVAVFKFFQKWDPKEAKKNKIIKEHMEALKKGGNCVFSVEGIKGYVHEKAKIRKAWEKSINKIDEKVVKGQCLVTGEETEILDVHESIKGVWNTQSSGAAIISFNQESFRSYGKEQSINAPVGKEAAFAYVTALNYMLLPDSIQNTRIGDATTVFWAERYGTGQEELFYALINSFDIEEKKENKYNKDKKNKVKEKPTKEQKRSALNDPQTIDRMRDFLSRVAQGKSVEEFKGYDPNVRFYVLGLSPNKSRISVRFFYADSFGKIVDRIKMHYNDMLIEKQYDDENDTVAVWQILLETAAQGKSENIPPAFSAGLMRAILLGGAYPLGVYQGIISRICIDKKVNRNRMAFIKAYLQRKNRINKKKGGPTMSLNLEERNIGYCLGRVFALLEKAQNDASPGINTTIKDRYLGAASAYPAAVFPMLLKLGQYHMAGTKYGKYTDKQIEEVLAMIDRFPTQLNLDDKGMFMLGYYHQRNALYKKKDENTKQEVK